MNPFLVGLGAGLQSAGKSAMQMLAEAQERQRLEDAKKEAEKKAKLALDQQLAQFTFQNNLQPMEQVESPIARAEQIGSTFSALRDTPLFGMGLGSAGDALSQVAAKSRADLAKGRTFEMPMGDGTTKRLYQRFEDTPRGRAEFEAKQEQLKRDADQTRAIALEREKARLKNERAFNTLQRLGAVPKGLTFADAADEDWEDLLTQHREERLARIRNSNNAGTVGTMTEFIDDQGRAWNRNSRTGALTPITMPDGAQAKAPPKSTGTPTEAEMKAAGYAQRMLTAEKTLTGMADLGVSGQPSRTQAFLQAGGSILPDSWAEGMANSLREPEQQVYNTSVADFINAFLRRDSGAAISAEEWARYAPMFTDRPSDSPEAKAQKRANRAAVTQMMVKQAGKAWSPDVESIAGTAASQALLPWTQKGMVSPTQALQNRGKK